ncbi:phage/plasmid replication protein, II/X family, partial [Acinetobacter baumannii]
KHFSDLENSGLFSRVFLQNLHSQSANNVIPFIKLVEIKFEEQVPDWFVEPVSTFRFKNIA